MDVFIQDAVRTPRGKGRASGGLANETPHSLIGHLVDALEDRTAFSREAVDSLTLGCVGQVGAQGGHAAMTAKIHADLSPGCTAHSLNNFCASGLSAIGLAAAAVQCGHAARALAGGVEMLSRVPFMADRADYYSDQSFAPEKRYIPVALAADRLADAQGITQAAMDAIALRSQTRAAATDADSVLQRSRIAVAGLDRDEAIRPTTAEALAGQTAAFADLSQQWSHALDGASVDHRMTLSHAPPMTDGAALALIGSRDAVAAPRARIVSFAEAGGEARPSLLAGMSAVGIARDRAGLARGAMGRLALMDAFAPPGALLARDFAPDLDRVNVTGGHIAKGHPMGATGAILLSTLLDALGAAGGRYGLVVVTGAQGVGAAMVVERL